MKNSKCATLSFKPARSQETPGKDAANRQNDGRKQEDQKADKCLELLF
jgi:hypothetical protein